MSDERRGEGTGAVVAIVVVFAIVLLLGVGVLVVGIGGYLFVSDVQVASVQVQTAVAVSDQSPPDPAPEDLSPASVPANDREPLSIEITADQKIIVGGEEVPFDKLQEKIRSGIQEGVSPQVILIQIGSGNEVDRKVFALLKELEVSFQIKSE